MGKRQRARMRALALAGAGSPVREDWFRIVNKAGSREATVYLYDEIGYFGTSASDFAAELAALDVDTINLRINSPGGEVFDGIAIHSTLKAHKAHINVIVDGLAASAASFIAMAGDTRTMTRHSNLMIHDASTLAWGDAAEMRRTADLLDRLSGTIANIYTQRCGKDAGYWRDLMREETWFNAEEAVEYGLADQVEGDGPADDEPTANASWNLSVYRYAGRSQAPSPSATATPEPPTEAKAEGGNGGSAEPGPQTVQIRIEADGGLGEQLLDAMRKVVGNYPQEAIGGVADAYDPAQRRDDNGRWTDGFPDTVLATTLHLGGRDMTMGRRGDGSANVTIGDTSIDLTADEAETFADWPHNAHSMDVGDTDLIVHDSHILAAITRDSDDTWRLGVSSTSDPLADPVTLNNADMDRLGDETIRLGGAQRVPVDGGRMDMWPAGSGQAGMRVRGSDEDRTVTEVKLSDREFGELHSSVKELHDIASNRADAAVPDDDEDEGFGDETDADTTRTVGDLTVALGDDDAITITPADQSWRVRLTGDQQMAWIDAATYTSEALDLLGVNAAFNRAVRALTRPPRPRTRAERAAADPWADMVAHLFTSDTATVADPLARLREAYK